ncbi:MAG: hypothetical protein HY738_21945, partial [Bacteroidia bacterium]|nr:hypothetical protein [Bacteroidia bacterium]
MWKKFAIIILILLILVGIFIGYKYLRKQTIEISPIINAVPINTAFIIETKNFYRLLNTLQSKSLIWNELTNTPAFDKINKQITVLDSLFKTNKEVRKLSELRSVIVSAHLTGKENYNFLFLLSLPAGNNKSTIYEFISDIIKGKGSISERIYNDAVVYDVKPVFKDGMLNFSFSIVKNIFIFSLSPLLVEESIRQIGAHNSLLTDKDFVKVQNTAGRNVDANLYINFRSLPKLLAIILNDNYKQSLATFTNCANWAELDVNLKKQSIMLNGFTYSNNLENNYLNIFKKQSPQRLQIENYLPDNTATFLVLSISDFNQLNKDFKAYLEEVGILQEHEAQKRKINEKYKIDIEEIFFLFLEKEIALVYTDVNNKDIDESVYVVFRTKSRSIAEEKLNNFLTNYSSKENMKLSDYIDEYKVDEETTFPIYTMPVKYLAGMLFGNIFIKAETNFFTFYDNFLIFGNSKKSLSKYLHNIVLQKTLKSDIIYSQFSENLSSKTNFYFYSNIAQSPGLFGAYLNDELRDALDKNINIIHKFQGFAVQFSVENEMIYNNIFLSYNPVFKQKPHTIWESRLDTLANIKPRLVINHNTQEKEIFTQDINNNIYLINPSGRILWKIHLDEPIISEVFQIDYYKNNKLQLLFNTKSKIHLIDRNGNYVERYPILLRSPATNGITVFDYENNKDYRLFVAGRDRKIYVYTKEGNILSGWEFDKSESYIRSEIQHIRISDKDYIVFADSLKIYILDRKGSQRIKLHKNIAKSIQNNIYLEEKTSKTEYRFVTTDTSGIIQYIYLDGN